MRKCWWKSVSKGSVAGASGCFPESRGGALSPLTRTILPYHTSPNPSSIYRYTIPHLTITVHTAMVWYGMVWSIPHLTIAEHRVPVNIVPHLAHFPLPSYNPTLPVCLSLFSLGHKPEDRRWSIKSQPAHCSASCISQASLLNGKMCCVVIYLSYILCIRFRFHSMTLLKSKKW